MKSRRAGLSAACGERAFPTRLYEPAFGGRAQDGSRSTRAALERLRVRGRAGEGERLTPPAGGLSVSACWRLARERRKGGGLGFCVFGAGAKKKPLP